MSEYKLENGVWICSVKEQWLPGLFKSQKACRLFYRLTDEQQEDLWEERLKDYGGSIPKEKDFEAALSEDDVRSYFRRIS